MNKLLFIACKKDPVLADKLLDLVDHPEKHKHDFAGLRACCMINGSLNTLFMEAHSEAIDFGTNGGQRCDVRSGPCSCGAWH